MKTLFCAIIVLFSVHTVSADWSTPVPITAINTANLQSGPWLSADNLTVYFNRYTYKWQIFQASRTGLDSPFGTATAISLSTNEDTSFPWLSEDGLTMYYTQSRKLRMATRGSLNGSWTPGQYFPELNVGDVECGRLSVDECTMVYHQLSANNTWDLCIATRPDKNSSFTARNLSELNSIYHDNAASLSADGLTIYFGSDRSGQWLIYQATRPSLDSAFDNLTIMPFPAGFNTPTISMDGKTMLLKSNTNPNDWDIYISVIPEPATLLLVGSGGLLLRKRN